MFLNYLKYCRYILHSYRDCLPAKDDSGQRWFKLPQYSQIRRSLYKCSRTTDGRRTPSEGKSFGSGELKTYILLHTHMINKVKIRLNIMSRAFVPWIVVFITPGMLCLSRKRVIYTIILCFWKYEPYPLSSQIVYPYTQQSKARNNSIVCFLYCVDGLK